MFNKSVVPVNGGLEEEFKQIVADYRKFQEQFKDPVVIASLLKRLGDEKATGNLQLKEIHAKLDRLLRLEERVARLEEALGARSSARPEAILSEVDEQLVQFAKEKGRVCAEDVQERFKYKGRNGASSRLNRLYEKGILEKAQAGKRVLYAVRRT